MMYCRADVSVRFLWLPLFYLGNHAMHRWIISSCRLIHVRGTCPSFPPLTRYLTSPEWRLRQTAAQQGSGLSPAAGAESCRGEQIGMRRGSGRGSLLIRR
ncbi:hypothetical protein ACQJBY_026921 [Aegilops geniculata]